MTTHETILLVEDCEDDVFLMQRALKSAGVSNPVLVVEDGQQAKDYLAGAGKFADRSSYPFPGLIFLDLKLPFIKGLDVLRWFRNEANLGNPIVVVCRGAIKPSHVRSKCHVAGGVGK
jgi:CheY-like chemotaxis protein